MTHTELNKGIVAAKRASKRFVQIPDFRDASNVIQQRQKSLLARIDQLMTNELILGRDEA